MAQRRIGIERCHCCCGYHSNSKTFDIDFNTAFNHWTRAEDLSIALGFVLQDNAFAPFIDETPIYATGFSYGGWSALSLAEVRGNREGFFQYCAAAGVGSQFCAERPRKMSTSLQSIKPTMRLHTKTRASGMSRLLIQG